MTKPDYRALCAELADVVYEYCILHEGRDHLQPLVDRARALLAQPVAEGPTNEELEKLVFDNYRIAISFACDSKEEAQVMISSYVKFARAVLAKWGNQ